MLQDISKKNALTFVVFIGVVSLFTDMTYEGARSITGPFLAILGANALMVGFVTGFGELLGYTLRLFSGYIADRTGRYWTITITGYVCNLIVVPLLALAGNLWMAATLIILERVGKAIRVPSRDAMLSHAGHTAGMGWAFGLHDALDKTGAMLGPLLMAAVLYFKDSYRYGFALLAIPAVCALIVLFFAFKRYPHPQSLELEHNNLQSEGLSKYFWIYLTASSLIAAGYADFPLVAYHFQKTALLSPIWIPISYAIAMGTNAMTSPLLGHYFDKKGFVILIFVTLLSSLFAPFVFLGNASLAIVGVTLWGIGLGAHESLMRAIVAGMAPKDKRGSAYGVFNTGFGIFWFLGSVLMGYLYDISILWLVIFSVSIQLLAIPLLWTVKLKLRKS